MAVDVDARESLLAPSTLTACHSGHGRADEDGVSLLSLRPWPRLYSRARYCSVPPDPVGMHRFASSPDGVPLVRPWGGLTTDAHPFSVFGPQISPDGRTLYVYFGWSSYSAVTSARTWRSTERGIDLLFVEVTVGQKLWPLGPRELIAG